MARFIHDGNSIDHTPAADVAAGDVVVQRDLIGIAKVDIAAGTLGALAVTGVFDFPKVTGLGTAIAAGTKVYWEEGLGQATSSSDNPYLGKALAAVGDNDTTVRVRVSQ